jgi:hypothetical protein
MTVCDWRVGLSLVAFVAGACGTAGDERRTAQVPESPLAAYPGFGHDPVAERAARDQRQELAMQRYIARCMHKAGFDYIAVASTVNAPSPPDPNKPYVASLSPDRLTRYYLTLYGVPDPYDEENLWDPRSDTGGGCWGEAIRAIRSVYAAKSELMTELEAMRRAIAQDPRVRAGEERWSECMRSRGYTYERPQSIPAREDSAAIRGAITPELQRDYREAREAAPACVAVARLDSIKTAVRVEKEAEFVRIHKDVLDRHVERLRRQQPLIDSLLARPATPD